MKILKPLFLTLPRSLSVFVFVVGLLMVFAGIAVDKIGGYESKIDCVGLFCDFTPGDWVSFAGFAIGILATAIILAYLFGDIENKNGKAT